MHCHLIAIKICVECRANQLMDLDCFAIDKYRLERLNTESMKRWSAVQQHWMIFDNFFQYFPHDRLFLLHHFFGTLDRIGGSHFFQLLEDEWLEQFDCHFLW